MGGRFFSFASFGGGAVVPLLPFLMPAIQHKLLSAMGLTGACLFAVGSALSLFSGRSAFLGGLRMLGIGAAAGAATYWIGKSLGVTLG